MNETNFSPPPEVLAEMLSMFGAEAICVGVRSRVRSVFGIPTTIIWGNERLPLPPPKSSTILVKTLKLGSHPSNK